MILSMSAGDSPEEALTWIFCCRPEATSLAETLTIPSASISNMTSIWGTPAGAGSMPTSSNVARDLFSEARSFSPWRTWTRTRLWLCSTVVNGWLFLTGMVVLRSMIFWKVPPSVSMPREKGVTSRRRTRSLTLPFQDPRLDGRAHGDDLVGIDVLGRPLIEELGDLLLDQGHAGLAADEDDLADAVGPEAAVPEGALDERDGPVDQVARQVLEEPAGEGLPDVLGPRAFGRNEREVDLGLRRERQFPFGAFAGLLDPLEGELVLEEVRSAFLPELVDDPFDDAVVEILPAQVGVPVRREDVEDAVVDLEQGDVERPPSHVENGRRDVLFRVQAERQARGRRLVDDAEDVEPADPAGVLGGLPLAVVEVGGHRDDGVGDLVAQEGLGARPEIAQDHGRDLLGCQDLGIEADHDVAVGRLDEAVGRPPPGLGDLGGGELAADQPLDREDRVLRIRQGLAHGQVSDQPFPGGREGDDRRGRGKAFQVGDDDGALPVEIGDAGVGRAQIDPDDASHASGLLRDDDLDQGRTEQAGMEHVAFLEFLGDLGLAHRPRIPP